MVLLLAFSLQDQVEKYGAYVGLAAFLGLAVLTLLYFAQARELKRLRDWAGRAPERAQELEARVVAQAEEARRAPEPAAEPSGTVGPAQPVQPAVAGNGRQPGAPVPIPMGPRPAVARAIAATATAEAPAVVVAGAPETASPDEAALEPAASDGGPPADDFVATDAAGEAAQPAADVAAARDDHEVSGDDDVGGPDEPGARDDVEGPDEPGARDDEVAGPLKAGDREESPEGSENGAPAEPPSPVAIPRATPRPQPRPAAPLRTTAASRSATLPPRRPAPAVAARRSEPSRAGRWTLFTLLGVAMVAAAIVVPVFLLGGEDEAAPPNTTAEPSADASQGTGSTGGGQAGAARGETVVTVLNGTPTEGLASLTRDKLIAEGYADGQGMIRTGNNTDQQRQDSVVLFATGKRRQARDVATVLGVAAIEPVDPETQALADAADETNSGRPADVVLVLGADQSP